MLNILRAFPSLHEYGHGYDRGSLPPTSIGTGLRTGFLLAAAAIVIGRWGGNDLYCTAAASLATALTISSGRWARDANHWVDAVVLGGIGCLSAMGAIGLGVQVLVTP